MLLRGRRCAEKLPVPSRRHESALHPAPAASPPNVDGETSGLTDCFRNRSYRTPFMQDVLGAVKLSSNV